MKVLGWRSELPTFGERVDILLSLHPFQRILGLDLRDQIIPALERRDFLGAELWPLLANFAPHARWAGGWLCVWGHLAIS